MDGLSGVRRRPARPRLSAELAFGLTERRPRLLRSMLEGQANAILVARQFGARDHTEFVLNPRASESERERASRGCISRLVRVGPGTPSCTPSVSRARTRRRYRREPPRDELPAGQANRRRRAAARRDLRRRSGRARRAGRARRRLQRHRGLVADAASARDGRVGLPHPRGRGSITSWSVARGRARDTLAASSGESMRAGLMSDHAPVDVTIT